MSFRSGPSYAPSNASAIQARGSLGVKPGSPIRIQCGYPAHVGNPLYSWYSRLPSRLIHKMQLRKEHAAPFFHEYIVFSIFDSQKYFRLERRQLPTEEIPLDCLAKQGVVAHDSIEETNGFNDSRLGSSDCLVEIEFEVGLHILCLLRACQAIQNHQEARMYTLQRYNCYFFAQTMIFCGVSDALGPGRSAEC
ncbi:hypothetical protein RhiTH_011711, partial [Rhizoctonia solani]